MLKYFGLAIVLVIGLGSTQAMASHYLLEDVSFIKKDEVRRFSKQGIEDTEDLLKKASTPAARHALGEATGLKYKRLLNLAKLCDLLQIKGLGPKMALLLTATGIPETDSLSTGKIDDIYPKMKVVNNKRHISEVLPRKEMVARWILAAKSVPIRLGL